MATNNARRLTATAWGAFGLLLAGSSAPVRAQSSLHDIPWYMAHDAARAATTKLCQSDHRFAHDVDCANAETAETRLYAQRAAGAAGGGQLSAGRSHSSVFDDLTSPQYWAANRLSRIGAMASCRNHPAFYGPEVCAAIQQGDAMDASKRSRP